MADKPTPWERMHQRNMQYMHEYEAEITAPYKEQIHQLQDENAQLREIVDALAHEDGYQTETGEGSMTHIAQLIQRARALLDEE